MSLKPTDPRFVPKETLRVAKAAFPKGSLALCLREVLEGVYDDAERILAWLGNTVV